MNRTARIYASLAVIEFAILATLPFVVPGCGLVSLVAFVPLLFLDRILLENSSRHSWLWIYSAFLLFNIGTTYWIWFVSPSGAIAAIVLNALQMTLVFLLFRLCRKTLCRCRPRLARFIPYIFLVVFWLGWEHIYYEVELSWPWLALGNALATSYQSAQWYEITGVTGGSLWILLCNILVFLAITGRNRKESVRNAAFSLAVVFVPLVLSLIRYHSYEETSDPCEVVVVQPNVDPFAKYGVSPQRILDENLVRLAEQVMTDSTEFVVTPETFTYAVDIDNPSGHPSLAVYSDFLSRHPSADLLLGALTYRTYSSALKPSRSAVRRDGFWYDSYNTALITDGDSISSHYFKSKLVPGVEIIPYSEFLPFLGPLVEKFGGSPDSYGTQDEMGVLDGIRSGHRIGAFICYESVYGDFSRMASKKGADILAVLTNDGWWGDTPGYRQHFRYARLRAIENRRDVIHAANTGTSGIINQRGDVLFKTGWWEETSFRARVNANKAVTPFASCGDIVGTAAVWLSVATLLIMLVAACASGRRCVRGKSA